MQQRHDIRLSGAQAQTKQERDRQHRLHRRKNGISPNAMAEISSVNTSTCHSLNRRDSAGIASRIAKVAAAKLPSTRPICDAESPMLVP